MADGIRIAFGLRADGRLVSVRDAERGLPCNCTCATCGARLVAKKGEILADHFAHAADSNCQGETTLHRLAKQIIADEKMIWTPRCEVRWRDLAGTAREGEWFKAERVEAEPRVAGFQPDVVLYVGDRKLAVEFLVSHPVPEEKVRLIEQQNLDCVEVYLTQFREESALEKIRSAVMGEAPRRWLHCADAAPARERLRLEWEGQQLRRQAAEQRHAREVEAEVRRLALLRRQAAAGGARDAQPAAALARTKEEEARSAAIVAQRRARDDNSKALLVERVATLLLNDHSGPTEARALAEHRLSRLDAYAAGLLVGAWTHGVGKP